LLRETLIQFGEWKSRFPFDSRRLLRTSLGSAKSPVNGRFCCARNDKDGVDQISVAARINACPFPGAHTFLAQICIVLAATLFAVAQSTAPPPANKSASTHTQKVASSKHKTSGKKTKRTASRRGQMKIDSQRAREIQQALIREHYLSGEPSGVWDGATESAMQKFQADNGWQDKTTPDSRALIKLGLGPDHRHLLNPESAMTEPRAQTSPPSSPPSGDTPSKTPQ